MASHIYSVPEGEPIFDRYTVSVDGKNAPVLVTRCSKMPFNRRWPGHQRQIEQSELCGMVRFCFEGSVTLSVKVNVPFEKVELRPSSKNVVLHRDNDTLTFTLTQPGGYSLEIDGFHQNLHIFADTMPCYDGKQSGDVLYYGPGYHEVGIVTLKSGQTVFLDEGAVVYGCFHAKEAENIKILGRGIIDNSHNKETILFEMEKLGDGWWDVHNAIREHTIHFINCKNIELDGFTIRDSLTYNVALYGCNDFLVKDIRCIGCWRYNSDGVDMHNCCNGLVTGCFIRTFDDTICYKGYPEYQQLCEHIVCENCVVWCDWDHCLEFGAECCCDHMRDLHFKNIDIIHSADVALNIGNVDYGTISDVSYEDIRIELDPLPDRPQMQETDEQAFIPGDKLEWHPFLLRVRIILHAEYSGGRVERGHIRDVLFRNIYVTGDRWPRMTIGGYDDTHIVDNTVLDGLYFNGKRFDRIEDTNVDILNYTGKVEFK